MIKGPFSTFKSDRNQCRCSVSSRIRFIKHFHTQRLTFPNSTTIGKAYPFPNLRQIQQCFHKEMAPDFIICIAKYHSVISICRHTSYTESIESDFKLRISSLSVQICDKSYSLFVPHGDAQAKHCGTSLSLLRKT